MSGAVSVLSVECPACCAPPGSPCLSDHAYRSGVSAGCDARRHAAGVVGAPSAWWVVDPGHAWLCVPLASVSGVSVSSFSYVDRERGLVYLEEDCDAGNWARFLGVKLAAFPVRRFDRPAPCRSLPRVHDGAGFVKFSAVDHGGRGADLCVVGRCGHGPYDDGCADPDYGRQPCCGLRVHVDDVGTDDPCQHGDECETRED